jgi:hypothetical protein
MKYPFSDTINAIEERYKVSLNFLDTDPQKKKKISFVIPALLSN